MDRALILVATLFLCWITVFGSARVLPSSSTAALSYSNFTFYVDSYSNYTYRSAISQLREELAKTGFVSDGIPSLPISTPVTSESRFVLLSLEQVGHYVTLALDVITANIVGFKVEANSYFFDNVHEDIYKSPLFMGTNKARLPFGSSYKSLEANGAFRENTTLGTYPLNDAVTQIYNYASGDDSINIAPSLLIIIQMITEAARFKYIENKLELDFRVGLVPKCDILSYEDNNSWTNLSFGIETSENGNIVWPVFLRHADCTVNKVSTVDQVIGDMGLLLGNWGAVDEQTIDWPSKGDPIEKLSSIV